MKKISVLLITLFMINDVIAQSCLPNGITFSTQAQIDNFHTNYPNCTQIEGDVYIISEHNITDLLGLIGLNSIAGSFQIYSNFDLPNLSGLDSLSSIGGDLIIGRYGTNPALTSLTGIDNLTVIGGTLDLSNNKNLTNINGLSNLTSIGGHLMIGYNDSLSSLTGLSNLTSIGLGVIVQSNNALTNLIGLNNVASIGSQLAIANNNALTSLTGLDNITSIGYFVYIGSNNTLTSLTGLDNLTSIGNYLGIKYNPALTSLAGLDNIDAGSILKLYIQYNYTLSICEVKSICEYLVSPIGTIDIHDNATGCNSQQEVELACGVGVEENLLFDDHLNFYPNPSSTSITIESPNKGHFFILNLISQQVREQEITEPKTIIDVSTLPLGVYIIKLINNKTIEVGKLIKD
jgi:hypothetical protein